MDKPKATLVTGGSNGIGAAIVQSRMNLGETVVNLDRAAPRGEGAHSIEVDLADQAALAAVLADVTATHDVMRIVNCAGVAVTAPLEGFRAEDFSLTMTVNLLAPALIVQACLPAMKARSFGRILNISSRSALGRGLRTFYASSKGALISATRVWALELGAFGITCNAIGPGPIETELYRAANPPESPATQKVIASVPVGRLGPPEDVAVAADFFLSDQAGFVTGQTLYVCGGLTIGGVAV